MGSPIELVPTNGLPLVDAGKVTLTLAYDSAESRLRFDAQWKFRTWYNEDAGQDFTETTIEICRRFGTLFLPNSESAKTYEGQPFGAETLLDLLKEYLLKLALVSSCPAIWMSIRSASIEELNASSWAELRGERIEIRPKRFYAKPFLLRPVEVDLNVAQRIAPNALKRYHVIFVEADWRFADGRFPDSIISLAQGLEMAAYDYALQPSIGLHRNFKPQLWFGPARSRDPKITAVNAKAFSEYALVCALFGARNAWIHEGNAMVPPFDPATDKVDKTRPEKLTRDHFGKFRSATSSALRWMGLEGI